MRLLLVRHAESVANAVGVLQGQADIGLSEKGRTQAAELGKVISALRVDRVVSSDLRRAVETADLLGYPECERTAQLREIDAGAWQGREVTELKRENYAAYAGWRAGKYTPCGGEGWPEFQARITGLVDHLSRCRAEQVLLVVHSGVVRGLLSGFLGIGPERMMAVAPASLTVVYLSSLDRRDGSRLELFNYSPKGPSLAVRP
jgi:glucosyl-3-phosphoglycerate phosphatase